MVQLPQDTPAVNGDGDVEVRLSYTTQYGECTVAGWLPEDDLQAMMTKLEGFR